MGQRYSIFSLARNALGFHRNWQRVWRSPPLRDAYDVVIVGAGGHGLAAAYYLAHNHGVTDVAVLDRGWLGGGNIARNTVTIRSNYLRDESIPFFAKSVELYKGLSRELNYNLMFSQRGMIDVVQTYPRLRDLTRRMLAMDIHGSTYRRISVAEVRRRIPPLTGGGPDARMPIIAGMVHPDAAVARHDAVAWALARAADSYGVALHQNTPVRSLLRGPHGGISGVETERGTIRANKVAVAVSGHTTTITETAGLRLPLKSYNLSAFVSEPLKPIIDVVVNCPDIGVYLSQSDKGELVVGGETDPQQSFRRGIKEAVFEDAVAAMLDLFPSFKRLKLLRQWGGCLDFAHDASPIVSATDIPGLFVSAGWWGGFKAVPVGGLTLAHLIATGRPHPLIEPFSLKRFERLEFILESGTTATR